MGKYDRSIDRILDIEWQNIRELKDRLDRGVTEKVIDLLLAAKGDGRKVITSGCGTSGIAAQRVAHMLCVAEIPALYCSPAGSVHGDMGAIQKGDLVILISKGGNTPEMTAFLPVCKAKGAKVIAVSQNDGSRLALEADVYFKIEVDREADRWNICGSASANAVCAVWDAVIFTAMEESGSTKDDLLLIHAGGGVGEILRGEK